MGQGLSNSSTELTVLNKRVLQREQQELERATNRTNRRRIVVHIPGENGYCSVNGPRVQLSQRSIKDPKQYRFSQDLEGRSPNAVSEERKPLYLQGRLESTRDTDSIHSVGTTSSASSLYPSTSSDSTSYSGHSTEGESRPNSVASQRTYTIERRVRELAGNAVGFSSRSDFHQYLMQPSIRIGSENDRMASSAWDQECEETDVGLEIRDYEEIKCKAVEPFISTCWDDFEEIELLDRPFSERNELPWKQRTNAFCMHEESDNCEHEPECSERTTLRPFSRSSYL